MRFQYFKIPSADPSRKWISRPLIPIRVIGPKGIWEGYGLIDSGADRSLFNTEIAEEIGLRLTNSQTENFFGIEGDRLKANLHEIRLQILGVDKEVEILAGFVDSPGVGAILGQDGFFDAFRIKFEKDHGIVEITPVKK